MPHSDATNEPYEALSNELLVAKLHTLGAQTANVATRIVELVNELRRRRFSEADIGKHFELKLHGLMNFDDYMEFIEACSVEEMTASE